MDGGLEGQAANTRLTFLLLLLPTLSQLGAFSDQVQIIGNDKGDLSFLKRSLFLGGGIVLHAFENATLLARNAPSSFSINLSELLVQYPAHMSLSWENFPSSTRRGLLVTITGHIISPL